MTEQEWLTCADPQEMLEWIRVNNRHRYQNHMHDQFTFSERKLRLFAEAIEPMLGNSSYDDVGNWMEELEVFLQPAIVLAVNDKSKQAALLRDIFGNPFRSVLVCDVCKGKGRIEVPWTLDELSRERDARYGPNVRHVIEHGPEPIYIPCPKCFGEKVPAAWLTWNDGITPRMARNMYDSRNFADMPILADALEEAGCPSEEECRFCKDADFLTNDHGYPMMGGQEPYASRAKAFYNRKCVCRGTRKLPTSIMEHCRADAPHVRGCWVVDCILGKE